MARVLCDPNYKPSELYFQIEGLLLFYDQVLLYAPSQNQIQQAGHDSQRLVRLIEAGLVVPVGRKFWFDPGERDALAAHFANNSEKNSTYRWSGLDDAILSVGRYTEAVPPLGLSRGFLVVGDDHRQYAEDMKRSVPRARSAEFMKLVDRASRLREHRRLPNELLHGPLARAIPELLAAHLVFCAAGDLRLCESLAVESVFSTPEMGEVYRAVGRSFIPIPQQPSGQLTVLNNPYKVYRLTEEELQMAARLAEQVVSTEDIGPLDLDLLLEYRQTSCSLLFREFVAQKLAAITAAKTLSDAELKAVFEAELDHIDLISDWAPYLGGITVATLGGLLLDERIQAKPLKRRSFFALMAGLSFGLFGDRFLPEVAPDVSARMVGGAYAKLFAVVKKQRDRQRRRSGRS